MFLDTYKKNKYRYFALSFALSFLVLSLMFFALMYMVHPKVPKSLRNTAVTVEQEPYIPSRDDALTVLFVGIAPGDTQADTFILAYFDPVRASVPIVSFPRHTAVLNNGKNETLEQVYRYGGASYTRDILAQTLGIPIDRFVRMDSSAFISAANSVGTVEFALHAPLTLGQSGAMPVIMNRGNQLVDGKTASEIIHHDEYDGGELARCAIISDLTCAIIDQRVDIALSTVVDKVFEKIINLIDTDISYPDYDDRKDAAKYLAQKGGEIAVPISVAGSYNQDETVYTLSDTFKALLTQTFI